MAPLFLVLSTSGDVLVCQFPQGKTLDSFLHLRGGVSFFRKRAFFGGGMLKVFTISILLQCNPPLVMVEKVEKVTCAFPQRTLISISEFQNSNWMGHHWIKPTNLEQIIQPTTNQFWWPNSARPPPTFLLKHPRFVAEEWCLSTSLWKVGGFLVPDRENPEGIHCFISFWLGRLWKAFFLGGGLDAIKIDWYI